VLGRYVVSGADAEQLAGSIAEHSGRRGFVDIGTAVPDNAGMKQKPTPEVISQTSFMRRTGLGRSRLQKLIREGLPQRDGKILLSEALAYLEGAVDPRRQESAGDTSLNELRKQREQIRIEESWLEVDRKGELVEKALVKRFISARARMERDQWLAWASAVSARLANSLAVDHAKLFTLIEDEVHAQLRIATASLIVRSYFVT
jgi:hypothetical protein